MITTEAVLAKSGIRAAKTLTRWHTRGLIPHPEVGPHPNGRGRAGLWPEWVVDRCQRIRQLVAAGFSLNEVADKLGSDWEAEEAEHARREKLGPYRMGEICKKMDRENCRQKLQTLVRDKLMPILSGLTSDFRKPFAELSATAFSQQGINKVIEMVRTGLNPMIVYDGNTWLFAADFVAGQVLSRVGQDAKALIVVPIRAEVIMAFSEIVDDFPDEPTVTPVARVRQQQDGGAVERDVNVVGDWGYEIADDAPE